MRIGFEGIIGGLFFAVSGVYMVVRGIKNLRIAARSADTAPSKVRSVAIGFAELEGKAVPNEPLTAPFSGRPCAYYLCEIERYERSGSGRNRKTTWHAKWQEEDYAPFSLNDGTGSIALNAEQAEFNCEPDRRWYLRPGSRFTAQRWREHQGTLDEFEPEAHRIVADDGGPRRIGAYRFTERIIASQERIYALGTVKRENDRVFVGLDPALGPFVISDRKQAELLTHMRRNGIGLIASGIGTAVFGVGILIVGVIVA